MALSIPTDKTQFTFPRRGMNGMKTISKVIAIMGILATIINFFACSKSNPDKQENHTTEIKFSSMTQEEKQNYVQDFLVKNYNIRNCNLTEIKHREITPIKVEDNYYTVATTEDGYWFSVWITPNNQIIDTAFVYLMKDEINSYIETCLLNNGVKCSVKDLVAFNEIPSKVWQSNEVSNMFDTENIDNVIHIYNIDSNISDQEIKNALKEFNGAIYIHYNSNDFENYDKFIDLD